MGALIRQYLVLWRHSWRPGHAGRAAGVPLRRWLVLLVFWPLFTALQLLNGAALCLDHWLFPGFRKVAVRQPLFVVGIPRSGTTFLHRLLAGDRQRFTTPALWELVFAPSIVQRRFWRAVGRLDRILCGGRVGRALRAVERRLLGGLDDVHQTGLWDAEEDYLALLPFLGCFLLVLVAPHPLLWRLTEADRCLPEAEKKRLMRAYRRALQRHLYVHGEHRTYLSKNPSFTPFIETLATEFADARFIGCLRNPSAAVPSQINAMVIGAALIDGHDTAAYWRERFFDMLEYYYRHLLDTFDAMPGPRRELSPMERLSAEPLATVTGFYQRFGWTPSPAYLTYLAAEQERARAYRSGHQYSLQGLGVDPGALHRRFAPVYQRFGYPMDTTD
ncbi:sulfotransferase family protein [Alcanivorax sp. N3-2A]|nr:sulfotransferase family protein [Alcanivorax sp. N3-2A]|tara:strand:+ start:1206 stop:2369 length:1164 start_codon:yes stop_codon:yes gene_type:complete